MKQCPIRWIKAEGMAARCIKDSCTFWVNGECAIVAIAKAITEDDDDDDDDDNEEGQMANMEITKLCPFRWGKTGLTNAKCVKGMCSLWANGKCAVTRIALSIPEEEIVKK